MRHEKRHEGVDALVAELEIEKVRKPDDEHTQVSVSSGDWAVTVAVSGLMSLDDLSWITGSSDDVPIPTVYLRAQTRGEVVDMLTCGRSVRATMSFCRSVGIVSTFAPENLPFPLLRCSISEHFRRRSAASQANLRGQTPLTDENS